MSRLSKTGKKTFSSAEKKRDKRGNTSDGSSSGGANFSFSAPGSISSDSKWRVKNRHFEDTDSSSEGR